MAITHISVHGARQHNLQDITVRIPRNTLTVVTGLSGSGKSSLAFDTIYAEGQRRYVETLSPYARQFLDQLERPDVDSIEGLSPAISIEQKTTNRSPRSTVGTITEIYDYLRLLYASVGIPHCPNCGLAISRQSMEQITDRVLALAPGERVTIYAPVVRGRKGEFRDLLDDLDSQGFRARIDGELRDLTEPITLERRKNHTIEAVVDRLVLKPGMDRKRLEGSIAKALQMANGLVLIHIHGEKSDEPSREQLYSSSMSCPNCGLDVPKLEPRSFSFNSTYGACPDCNGLGSIYGFDPAKVVTDWTRPLLDGGLGPGSASQYLLRLIQLAATRYKIDLRKPFEQLDPQQQKILLYGPDKAEGPRTGFHGIIAWLQESLDESRSDSYRESMLGYMSATECSACQGQRLRPESLAVRVGDLSIAEFTQMPLGRSVVAARSLAFSSRDSLIAERLRREIVERLQFLNDVGLSYLSLDRNAATLSGGEGQRIRLATQIGSRLRGVLYVLDEPSIGLHQRDNMRLIAALESLRDLGNTVLVVEHDEDTIRHADYVLDLGPGAGKLGGHVIAQGKPEDIIAEPRSLTGRYLSGNTKVLHRERPRGLTGKWIEVEGAEAHNLNTVTARIPLGVLSVITGVSGSGKSTLVNDTLYRALARELYGSREEPGKYKRIRGFEQIDKAVRIDQSPIGRTPRSNPATYTGVFAAIRDLFAMLPEARERGYKPGRFSFNVSGGRCEACQGDGQKRIEMNFLPDVYVLCDVCNGRRYNQETLAVRFKGLSIADILELSIEDALPILADIPQVRIKLQTLVDVGLGYIHLGQAATTLSGGEAQRMKLARELSKRQTGKTLYLLDEPTTGLHFDDVHKLLDVLHKLTDLGNTVLIIEHNLDVIRNADWILDMGPEGGEGGGLLVAEGPPSAIAAVAASHTGSFLVKYAHEFQLASPAAEPPESSLPPRKAKATSDKPANPRKTSKPVPEGSTVPSREAVMKATRKKSAAEQDGAIKIPTKTAAKKTVVKKSAAKKEKV
jgi:excinuclease ABC subunit A